MKAEINNTIPALDTNVLREAIWKEYTEVACNKDHTIHFTSGRPLAERLQYHPEVLSRLPEEAIRPFAGVGNPHSISVLHEGSIILDIGCGAGMDCLSAWIFSAGECEIFGMDMTDTMLEKARENAAALNADIRFIKGFAEDIPLPSGSVDTVISNGVINLCPDKARVYSEIFRVLKPGGNFMIADVLLENPVPTESRELVHLWTNCVAGAIPKADYLEIIRSEGFIGVEITGSYDVFKDARVAKSAAHFGAKGYDLRGIKPNSRMGRRLNPITTN